MGWQAVASYHTACRTAMAAGWERSPSALATAADVVIGMAVAALRWTAAETPSPSAAAREALSDAQLVLQKVHEEGGRVRMPNKCQTRHSSMTHIA